MKWISRIVGLVLAALGALWFLQGVNIVRAGFMAGHLQYALLGIAAIAVGVSLVLFSYRRQKSAPSQVARDTRGQGSA